MLAEMCLGNEFLDHNVQHRACRGGQQPRHERRQRGRAQHDQNAEDRLDDAGQRTVNERACAAQTLLMERERDCGSFRKVLNADADGKRACGCKQSGVAGMLCCTSERQADRHALRNIVQCHRKDKQRCPPERGRQTFGLLGAAVQMRHQAVQREHEHQTEDKTACSRYPAGLTVLRGLVYRGNEQTPDGCRNHHAGRESEENLLHQGTGLPFHKEYHSGANRGHQEGESCACGRPKQCLLYNEHLSFLSVSLC